MRLSNRLFTSSLFLVCFSIMPALAADPTSATVPVADAETIKALIADLDNNVLSVREKAQKELVAIGSPAKDALIAAAKSADSQRVKNRVTEILTGITLAEKRKNFLWGVPVTKRTNNIIELQESNLYILGVTGKPVVAKDVVLALGEDGEIHAVSAKTGKELWATNTVVPDDMPADKDMVVNRGRVVGEPAAGDDLVIYPRYDYSKDKVVAVDLQTGKKVWDVAVPNGTGLPVIGDNQVYLIYAREQAADATSQPASNGGLEALDVKTGKRNWRIDNVQSCLSTAFVGNGMVLVGEKDSSPASAPAAAMQAGKPGVIEPPKAGATLVRAFDSKNGKELWKAPADHCKMIWSAGGLIVLEIRDGLIALDPKDGKKIWTADLPEGNDLHSFYAANGANIFGAASDRDVSVNDDVICAVRDKTAIVLDARTGNKIIAVNLELNNIDGIEPDVKSPRYTVHGIGMATADANVIGVAPFANNGTLPLVKDNIMYIAASNGIHAFDIKTGRRLWQLPLNAIPSGKMALVNDTLYFGTLTVTTTIPPLPEKPGSQLDNIGINALKIK